MAVQIIGVKATSAPRLIGFTSNYQWFTKPSLIQQTPAAGFVETLGMWVKQVNAGWGLMLGIYEVFQGNGQLMYLMARTNLMPIAVNTGAGFNAEQTLEWVDTDRYPGSIAPDGSTQGRLYLPAGFLYGLAWTMQPISGQLPNQLVSAGTLEATNSKVIFGQINTAKVLTNPFAYTTQQGSYPNVAIYGTLNVVAAPTVGLTAPTDAQVLTTTVPQFSGTFVPAETFDGFTAYQVEVWAAAGSAPLRDSGILTATSNQQATKTWQYTYDGPALSLGASYKWRARVQARAGGWSAYTDFRTFSTTPPDPTGSIDLLTGQVPANGTKIDRPDLMTWAARWIHNLNEGMDRIQIQIRNPDETVVVTSNAIPMGVAPPIPTAPPGKLFTVSQVEQMASGFSTAANLQAGRQYRAYLSGRSATTLEWTAWAGPITFRTNALAGAPELVTPAADSAFSTRPQLIVRGYDPDVEDVPGTDTIWQFEILRVENNSSTVVSATSYVMGATPSLNEARFQLTSTQVPAFGVYRWRARSVEAAAGTAGTSAWTDWRTFTYNSGPTATITSPVQDEAVPTSAIRIAWTNSEEQKFYQVQVFEQNTDARRYVTNVIQSAALYHDVPLGELPPEVPFYARVTVFNPTGVQGTSPDVRFTIVPGSIVALQNCTVEVLTLGGDVEPTTPELRWNRSGHPEVRFREYLVRRYETALGRATAVMVGRINDIGELSLRDYHAPPGVDLTWLVSQRGTNDAGEVTESSAVQLSGRVELLTPVITALSNPSENRFLLRHQTSGPPSEKLKPRRSVVQTWGADGKPTIFKAPGTQKVLNGRFTLVTDEYGTAAAKKERIQQVLQAGGLVSYRKGSDRRWIDIADNDFTPGEAVGTWDVTLQFEETAYREILG